MYWQKRFDRVNPDKEIEEKILEVRKNNKDYGYRRIYGALRNLGYIINKKESSKNYTKNQAYRLHHSLEKVENTIHIKEKLEKTAKNRIRRRFNTNIPHQKITTDTTEFKYYEVNEKGKVVVKKLYLDPFMDMYNG